MWEQVGMAVVHPDPLYVAWVALSIVALLVLALLFQVKFVKKVWSPVVQFVTTAHFTYHSWRAKREMKMNRKRERALRDRTAAAMIQWLMYQVYSNEMTLEESYEMQRLVARTLKHPAMSPLFDPDFVKGEIKKRRKNGIHKPVALPGMSAREKLRSVISAA